jgi:hypothetical protein
MLKYVAEVKSNGEEKYIERITFRTDIFNAIIYVINKN